MRTVVIQECQSLTPEEVHSLLWQGLAFPDYYGENLDALSDCLEELAVPSRVVLRRAPIGHQHEWLDRFAKVIARAAGENDSLEFSLENQDALSGSEGIAARLAAVEERLGGSAVSAELLSDKPVRRLEAESCRNTATGSEGDRFACSNCGCRVGDWIEESRFLFDGLLYCPNCGSAVDNPGGTDAAKWLSELV